MKPQYIIDGYNMIRRIDFYRAKFNQSAEKGRDALVVQLANFRRNSQSHIIVVFDGDSAGNPKSGIKTIFSKSQTADDVIKKMVDKDKHLFAITVVSSDLAVMRYAKSCGCEVISSEDFHKKISTLKNDTMDEFKEKNDPQLSSKEIAQWLDIFNKR